MIDWWICHSFDCVLIYWIVQPVFQILPKKFGTDCLGLALVTSDEKTDQEVMASTFLLDTKCATVKVHKRYELPAYLFTAFDGDRPSAGQGA